MPAQVLQYDVFTSQPGKGNPAGIVLPGHGLNVDEMQRVAAASGCNDTAFISTGEHFGIRYFSPRKEVDLCGHATIAAALALHSRGFIGSATASNDFQLQTRAGLLPIALELGVREPRVLMSQAPSKFQQFSGDRSLLVRALGLDVADLHPSLPIIYGSTGRWTLIVPVRGLGAMRRMRPNTAMFADVLAETPGASIHPVCLETVEPGVHMHARHFSHPDSGTVEDPVTGTASGVLGAYYTEFIDPQREMSQPLEVEQGYEMGREGRVTVWASRLGVSSYTVRIGGTACFVGERTCS